MEVDLKDFSQTADPVIPDISSQPGEVDDLSYLDPIKNGVLDALLRIEINTQPKKKTADFTEVSTNIESLVSSVKNNQELNSGSNVSQATSYSKKPVSDKEKTPTRDAIANSTVISKNSSVKESEVDEFNASKVVDFDSLETASEAAINRSKQTAENYLKMELANLKKSEYFANESMETKLIGTNEVVNTTKTIDSNEAAKTTNPAILDELSSNNAIKYSAIKPNNSTKKSVADKEKLQTMDVSGRFFSESDKSNTSSLVTSQEEAIKRSKSATENYSKIEPEQQKNKPNNNKSNKETEPNKSNEGSKPAKQINPINSKYKPTRDASGRFLPKADKGEKALEETKENKRNKSLSDTIKDAVIGKNGAFSRDKGGGSGDDVGNAAGGTFYGAFKEMKGVYDKFSDPENPVLKAFSDIKENTFGEKEKQPSASGSGEDLIKNELTDISESSSDITELVSKVSSKTEDLESTLEIKNSITEQTTKQEKNHGIIAKLLKKIGRSSRGGGGSDGFSLSDILSNKKTRSSTPRGRPPTPKAGGGFISRIGGTVAEKAGGVASKAGGLAKGALGLGSKALGALAAPIAGIMSFSSKKEELSTRDDLTDSQKTTQAAATGIGAGGGALAGAAMGAAVGSVIPFVGTLIGGVVGGIIGAYGGEWVGEKAGEAIAGGDGSDAKAKTEDVVSESEDDLLASKEEAKEAQEEAKKESQEEAKQDDSTEAKESQSDLIEDKKPQYAGEDKKEDGDLSSYKSLESERIQQSNLESTSMLESNAIDSSVKETAIKETPVYSAEIKEVGGGFTANELLASEISAPEKLATTKASKQALSSTGKPNQQGFDSKLIAIELAKIIKSNKEPGSHEKKTDKPSSVSATNIIPAEFDDTLMALISHDRV